LLILVLTVLDQSKQLPIIDGEHVEKLSVKTTWLGTYKNG